MNYHFVIYLLLAKCVKLQLGHDYEGRSVESSCKPVVRCERTYNSTQLAKIVKCSEF
jgi:hypothetical protein